MDDGKHHHSCLDDAEALKKVDAASHSEGGQEVEGASQLVRLMAAVMALRRLRAS